MIFQHSWEKILSGEKTQTRRLEVFNHNFEKQAVVESGAIVGWRAWYISHKGRRVYEVGKTYAVQPGRGKPAIIYNPDHPCYGVDIIQPGDNHYKYAKEGTWGYKGQGYMEARIRITDIRREDVRCISAEDVKAEGLERHVDFWETWCKMHDKGICVQPGSEKTIVSYPRVNAFTVEEHNAVQEILMLRPAEKYQAWALTFELVMS